MVKYLYLQLRRVFKMFPFVVLSTAILFGSLALVFTGMVRYRSDSEDMQKIKIGIVGDAEDTYLDLGISALKAFDDTRFAMELEALDESSARDALSRREISAYIVFPEGFVKAAYHGEIRPVRLVTFANSGGLILIFKNEITRAVTELLHESQKGVFGLENALDSNGFENLSYEYINKLYVKYVNMIFLRSKLYSVEELGISDDLNWIAYYIFSFFILLLLLVGLPYAAIFVKRDLSLRRVLAARGLSPLKQLLCEYAAYVFALFLLSVMIAAPLFAGARHFDILGKLGLDCELLPLLAHIFPVVAMVAAFHMVIYELSGNLVNGILLQFFTSISLSYITGFFYPIYAFPKVIQRIAPFLPTGAARGCLSSVITGESAAAVYGVCGFAALFLAAAWLVRKRKMTVGA